MFGVLIPVFFFFLAEGGPFANIRRKKEHNPSERGKVYEVWSISG